MDNNQIVKRKWFWVWQDDKEEAWLSEMAAEGYHLEEIGFPGKYTFNAGEPANYVYRMDYQTSSGKERDSYLQLFEDSGWEHVGDMNGWIYFRILAEKGETPDIFSDKESKVKKYHRVMTYLIIFLPILFVIGPQATNSEGPLYFVTQAGFAVIMLLYATAMLNLLRRISKVQQSS